MTESGGIGTHSTSTQYWRWNRGVTLVFAFHSWMGATRWWDLPGEASDGSFFG